MNKEFSLVPGEPLSSLIPVLMLAGGQTAVSLVELAQKLALVSDQLGNFYAFVLNREGSLQGPQEGEQLRYQVVTQNEALLKDSNVENHSEVTKGYPSREKGRAAVRQGSAFVTRQIEQEEEEREEVNWNIRYKGLGISKNICLFL